jgi:hypothetical protein
MAGRQNGAQEGKRFFFEKKNQKTFGPGGVGDGGATAPRSESFLLLFFKKEALALLLAPCDAGAFVALSA